MLFLLLYERASVVVVGVAAGLPRVPLLTIRYDVGWDIVMLPREVVMLWSCLMLAIAMLAIATVSHTRNVLLYLLGGAVLLSPINS